MYNAEPGDKYSPIDKEYFLFQKHIEILKFEYEIEWFFDFFLILLVLRFLFELGTFFSLVFELGTFFSLVFELGTVLLIRTDAISRKLPLIAFFIFQDKWLTFASFDAENTSALKNMKKSMVYWEFT